ncbi:MAG: tetraacyldisaccharide 4'-kinase [Acidobacteriota bacterium]|nr:tetraacyldisaccharide 4'-kinase [Acidobacteriota bacterium]
MRQIERGLIFLLYGAARILAIPLLLVYFLIRCCQDPKYFRGFAERLGMLPASFKRTVPGGIWLHAVSVGEVISSVRLVEELRKRDPDTPIFISTATLAGRAVAEQKLRSMADGIFYAPLDYAFVVRRVLRRIRPAVVVILETEIWPVLFREVKRAQCGLLVFNGRISDRTAGRYRRFRWVFRSVLRLPDAIYVQTERDRLRYIDAGAPPGFIQVAGNLKHDAAAMHVPPPSFVTELLQHLNPTCVWIGASTMPGMDADDVDEDDVVIGAYRELAETVPGILLILAPRRPERFTLVQQKLRGRQVSFVRRSDGRLPPDLSLPCVLVLDTIGELASIFPLVDVVFMGGTLARRGGHNVLEPGACHKAIIVGPHMENFAAIAQDFREADAWLEIPGPSHLAAAVRQLLVDASLRETLGTRAAQLAQGQTGIAARFADLAINEQDRAVPNWLPRGPGKLILWLLSRLWRFGGRLMSHSQLANRRTTKAPVISIGGIAMGGSGKTPFVEMLARDLHEQGLQAAILTRGYRRQSREPLIVEAGSSANTGLTGDEAQILVRSGCAHVGIGEDRGAIGMLLESKLHVDVFLLDDGFQHRKLARQLDIVLIDALDPFPGGAPFPLGYLREPLEALRRADVFVITRAQSNRHYQGIRSRLREMNATAPILSARVEAAYWVNERTKERVCQIGGPVLAFCGLGNPAAFWQTLRKLGIDPVVAKAFRDHHRYNSREFLGLILEARLHGAIALVTTEKDVINLPGDTLELLAGVELYWLKIATAVQEKDELKTLVEAAMSKS